MPKVSKEDYEADMSNDPDLIGIKLIIEYDGNALEQHFIIDDCSEELGIMTGTFITMLRSLQKDDSQLIPEESISGMKKKWRRVIRG